MAKPTMIIDPRTGTAGYTKKKAHLIDVHGFIVNNDGLLVSRDSHIPDHSFSEDELSSAKKVRHASGKLKFHRRGVYILKSSAGLYKIGKTVNLPSRMAAFWSHVPEDLELFAFLPCTSHTATETILHQEFASRWVKGEWFRLSEDDAMSIIERGFILIQKMISSYLRDESDL